jgi:hypothetical protein
VRGHSDADGGRVHRNDLLVEARKPVLIAGNQLRIERPPPGREECADRALLVGHDPQAVFAKDGLFDELKKALAERVLKAEIDDPLDASVTVEMRSGETSRHKARANAPVASSRRCQRRTRFLDKPGRPVARDAKLGPSGRDIDLG